MHWLITGGCGFIGTNLIRKIAETAIEDEIRILDSLSIGSANAIDSALAELGSPEVVRARTELIVGDITDVHAVERAMAGVDIVIHLAAKAGVIPSVKDPRSDFTTNTIGTFNCLEAARKMNVEKFVFISSGAALGEQLPPLDETCVPSPLSPYGASKLACEGYCAAYRSSFGLRTVVLRFSNVYGPYSVHKGSVIAKYIRTAIAGDDIVVYGDGTQTRDYLYVDDAIDAIRLCATNDVGHELFHIATGTETTLNNVTKSLGHLLEPRVGPLRVVYRPYREGEVMRSFADASRAQRELGWRPKTPLELGLSKTVDWYLRSHNETS